MPLHRLTVPTYPGGLPGTHDYINDPATNGDPGVPAPADGKKAAASSPGDQNEGTYFIAFSEPAQALNLNRPARALAENTDFLDDVIHRPLAIPAFQDVASGHGGTISLVLTGAVFVGSSGTPNDQGVRDQLIQVVDPVTGVPIVVQTSAGPPAVYAGVSTALVHDGSSVNQIGNEFFVNPTVDFTVTIPTATAFRVLFHVRGRLKDEPTGVLTRVRAEPVGLGGALASIQAILGDAAFKNLSNTFAAAFTQNFLGPISQAGTVTLTKPDLTPSSVLDGLSGVSHTLLGKYLIDTSIYLRVYVVGQAGGIPTGLEITLNAEWTGSVPNWTADANTREPARLQILTPVSGTHAKVAFHSLAVGTTSWAEVAWTTVTSGVAPTNILEFLSGAFSSGQIADIAPGFATTQLVATDPTAGANNPYKHIMSMAAGVTNTGVSRGIRIYAGNDDVSSGTAALGEFVIVSNAIWNPVTRLWVRENSTYDAHALFFRLGRGGVVSGLTGSGLVDGNQHGNTSLAYLVKTTGTASWTAQNWDKSKGSAGHLFLAGEYGYAAAAGGKAMQWYPNPADFLSDGDWALDFSVFSSLAAAPTWSSSATSSWLILPLNLPTNATITECAAQVIPLAEGTTTHRMSIFLFEQVIGGGLTDLGHARTDGTSAAQQITVSVTAKVQQTRIYYLGIRHSTDSALAEVLSWARVRYNAPINLPGPGEPILTFTA